MNRLRDWPIKRKVTFVILFTCSAVLLLAGGIMAGYQIYDFRNTMVKDTKVLAEVLAESVQGALAFQDEDAATQRLRALQAEPVVAAACLYSKDGSLFANYARAGGRAEFPRQPPPDGHLFKSGFLVVVSPVMLNDKRIGTILMRSDLQGLYDRFYLFGGMAALVLIGSCLVAFVLSSPLQKPITGPILALTETVRRMTQEKNYTVQLPPQSRDETGLLTDAFNQLLTSINDREKALRAANESLREEVVERKSAEDRVQAQLGRLELLQRITRATGERLDLNSIFQVVVRTVEDQLPADFCCICLHDPGPNVLVVSSVGAQSETFAIELAMSKDARLDLDQSGLKACISGRLVYEPDVTASPFPFPQRLVRAGLRAFVAAPLLVESKIFGVLLAARRQTESFSSGECEFLRQLTEHVALAAQQAQLHAALQQAYDDLRQTQQAVMQQERLRALGQMASGIAHDINNAISPVALYTESLLETEPNLSPRARDYLGTIQHSIEDVAQTVARMREFYRQREPQLTLLPVRLNLLVQQVLDLSRARWSDMPQKKGVFIEMSTDLAADLPPVRGVESEIREALLNLIFNAVDAMPEGGKLKVRTTHLQNPTPSENGGARGVAVEITDTGSGMDDDTRRRCLEPFFTTKGERGTGLGLAMVYGIAQRHGADIEIESAVGQGTTMRLVFPTSSTSVQPEAAVPSSPVPKSRLRILVVDDDPLLIKSLREVLETDGHVVVTTNGGQAGIDAFSAAQERNERFSVVITDLGMPYVDGRKVASAIKEASPATPVILLTGWGQRLVAEGDIPPHVDKVLNKPPKLRELREALAGCQQLVKS